MFGITTTRRMRAELAAAKAETDRQRERAEKALSVSATARYNREQALRQLADLDAVNRRLSGRNLELGRRLSLLAESDPEYAARLERRVGRLLKVVARLYTVGKTDKARADQLQGRLDQALGLDDTAVLAGSGWQGRRADKNGRTKETTP